MSLGRAHHGRPDHGRAHHGRSDHGRAHYRRSDHGRADHARLPPGGNLAVSVHDLGQIPSRRALVRHRPPLNGRRGRVARSGGLVRVHQGGTYRDEGPRGGNLTILRRSAGPLGRPTPQTRSAAPLRRPARPPHSSDPIGRPARPELPAPTPQSRPRRGPRPPRSGGGAGSRCRSGGRGGPVTGVQAGSPGRR